MPQIEWSVLGRLRDEHDLPPECVGDTSFVEDVGVAASEVADYDLGSRNERDDIVDEHAVFPDVVGPLTHPSPIVCCRLQGRPNGGELSTERHHDGDPVELRSNDRQRRCRWSGEADDILPEKQRAPTEPQARRPERDTTIIPGHRPTVSPATRHSTRTAPRDRTQPRPQPALPPRTEAERTLGDHLRGDGLCGERRPFVGAVRSRIAWRPASCSTQPITHRQIRSFDHEIGAGPGARADGGSRGGRLWRSARPDAVGGEGRLDRRRFGGAPRAPPGATCRPGQRHAGGAVGAVTH
jgi:hypothetical protein